MQGTMKLKAGDATASAVGLSNALQVSTSASRLYMLTGLNTGPNQWIMVFDAARAPADTTVPLIPPINVLAGQNFSMGFGDGGRPFANGIYVCNSTTAGTKTIGAANCFFDVLYRATHE